MGTVLIKYMAQAATNSQRPTFGYPKPDQKSSKMSFEWVGMDGKGHPPAFHHITSQTGACVRAKRRVAGWVGLLGLLG
jgi:hypothetical protein